MCICLGRVGSGEWMVCGTGVWSIMCGFWGCGIWAGDLGKGTCADVSGLNIFSVAESVVV